MTNKQAYAQSVSQMEVIIDEFRKAESAANPHAAITKRLEAMEDLERDQVVPLIMYFATNLDVGKCWLSADDEIAKSIVQRIFGNLGLALA
jgi:hypothetical protein